MSSLGIHRDETEARAFFPLEDAPLMIVETDSFIIRDNMKVKDGKTQFYPRHAWS